MKNILFVALLSTVALGSSQSSYAVKTPSDREGKSSSSTSLPVHKSMKRKPAGVWMPSAPWKAGSAAQRYWEEVVARDGGRTKKIVDNQLWTRKG
jgi:hypothetical protein